MAGPSSGSSPAPPGDGPSDVHDNPPDPVARKAGACRRCLQWTWSLAVPLFGVLLAIGGYEMVRTNMVRMGLMSPHLAYGEFEDLRPDLPDDLRALFMGYDQDLDGYLSIEEFENIYPSLVGEVRGSHLAMNQMNQTDLSDYNFDHEVLLLASHFQPLLMDTMEKANDKLGTGFDAASFDGLKAWQAPIHNLSALSVEYFQPLLANRATEVGGVWNIIEASFIQQHRGLSSTRLYPNKPVVAAEALMFKLLSHFHPRPFVSTRFGPYGCKGMLIGESDEYLDIIVRLHSEFQLNSPPQFSYWFTPGQFLIRLIINRASTHIHYFNMHVPATKALNVDMEWQNSYSPQDGANMEVDIGLMPQMELRMHSPSVGPPEPESAEYVDENGTVAHMSVQPAADALHHSNPQLSVDPDAMNWTTSVPMAEALSVLERAFFDFKKVPYEPFLDAFQRARRETKLVHLILLWGVLDDQSC